MKRGAVITLVAVAGVVAGLVALSFSSRFQTWVAARVLAGTPELGLTVGNVDAGLSRAVLRDVRWVTSDAVLTAPVVIAELPLLTAGFSERFEFKRLEAKGWTITLKPAAPSPGAVGGAPGIPAGTGATSGTFPAAAAVATGATLQAFAGIFTSLEVPRDVSLEQVDLEGTIIPPDGTTRVAVSARGGGLRAGQDGEVAIRAAATLADQWVSRVTVQGSLRARMDTPRTLSHLGLKLVATAEGSQLPEPLTLASEVTAQRSAAGESYAATLTKAQQQLLEIRAEFPPRTPRLAGTWKLDLRSVDLAPFTLGQPLPTFTLAGAGTFDADAKFVGLRTEGKLSGTVSRLEVVSPKLAAVDQATFDATFDVAQQGPALLVERFAATLHSTQPVLAVRTLERFALNPRTGELLPRTPTQDLLGIQIFALPLRWTRPLLSAAEVQGGLMRGELVVTARAGGVALRSSKPLQVDALAVTLPGRPAWPSLDVSFNAAADYTPGGWQAEVGALTVRSGTAPLLLLDAKAGQLKGAGEALKTAGKLSADLPTLLALAGPPNSVPLTGGSASVEFVASLSEKQEIQAKVSVRELAAVVDGRAQTFPAVTTDLRADIASGGEITVNAPLVIEQAGRTSDLRLAGAIGALRAGTRSIEGNVTSSHLVLDDARILGALFADPEAPVSAGPKNASGGAPATRPARSVTLPPWAAWHGSLALQLKRVVLLDTFELTQVGGRLRIDAGTVKFETVHAGLGESGLAQVDGELNFNPAAAARFGLAATLSLREFNPGPLLRQINPEQPPAVEGRFEIVSRLSAGASSLAGLPAAVTGDLQFTSKGGVFRGLPVNASNLAETSSRIAAFITSAGAAIGALTGRRDYLDVANKAEAVAELARTLSAIKFDQLSARLTRDEALTTRVQDFSLISPELRLAGGGVAVHTPGLAWFDDALALEFILKARGRQGDLLRYLGLLEPQGDDLGYAACTVPVRIGGTLGAPDATEFSQQITSLALEKSGLSEKAAELLGRFRSNGK